MVIFALTLVRHGETGHNKDNVIQGQLDVPLSSVGIEQALRLGNHLQNQKYTHVYASDLSRAKLTAESILEKSQVCHVNIVEDKRLRERKFGVIEGKSFKHLKEVASKSNQSVVNMTPLGAETVQQVQSRAVSFFKELCQLMCSVPATNSSSEDHPTSNGNCTPSSPCSVIRNKRKREDSCDSPPTDSTKNDTNNPTKSKSSNQVEAVEELSKVAPTFSDEAIRNHLTPCKCETEDSDCPNVSLSPLVSHNNQVDVSATASVPNCISSNLLGVELERERRSSICSSNDENDSSGPDLAGNVLIVSHGGLLKEMVRYFVEELTCELPGGKKQAMRISPNAGLSKFTVSLNDSADERPKIICHQIHDKHHLHEIGSTRGFGNADTTAL